LSWVTRWELERDEHQEQLQLLLEPGSPIAGTRRGPPKDIKVSRP
jgi:hypothetical protein